MTSAGYLRFPHICGDLLAFAADDDVWLAPASGGRAWRLSSDHAPASHPRLSPDGRLLAWTSVRDGAPEVYLCDVDEGRARRLTHWGDGATRATGWTPDGDVLALTAAAQPFERYSWAYAVPAEGGAPRRQPFGPLADIGVGDGGAVALLNGAWGRDPAYWKRYRGGTSGRLWVRATGGQEFRRVLAGVAGQFASPMLAGDRLVFLSDHEGTGNLYSCRLDGSELRRHTDHDGFYARQASTDGHRIVYQCAGQVWILDDLAAEARPVEVSLGGAAPPPSPRLVSAREHLGELSCDQTGQASAIEVSGTVHWLTHTGGPARALHVAPGARARLPRVLGTDGQVAWVSDAGGRDALEIAPGAGEGAPTDREGASPGGEETASPGGEETASPGGEETASPGGEETASRGGDEGGPRRLAAGQLGRVERMAAAPDGSTVAVASRDGRLQVVDVASGGVTVLATSQNGPVTGLVYSPDSAWLAWSHPEEHSLSRIRLARVADAMVVDATDGRFSDTDPVFTGDGRYLAFLSRRSFDPVYDAHFFDLSFPLGCRPYLIPLAAAAPSPFGPLTGGRPVDGEQAAKGGGDTAGEGAGPGQPRPAMSSPAVTIDAEGLPGRVTAVPVEEARYESLRAVTGGLAWLKRQVAGVLGESSADPEGESPRPVLERFDFAKRTCAVLAGGLDWFEVSGDGNKLVIRDKDELRVVASDRKDGGDGAEPLRVDLERARFLADPAAQRRHAFDEAGRGVRHDFWVPDMAEVDWDGVLDTYRPLLEAIRTASDFADLLWEVLGELGTSHAYVRPAPPSREPATPPVAFLGADIERAGDGTWRVARVLPGESSDPRARSPLAAPGVTVAAGAALLAVDGQPVDPVAGPGPLLVGAARKPVELTVSEDGRTRRVAVVPLASDRRLRYQDWVAANRRHVRDLSHGRAGYLHVPDMMGEGWAHFHRDLRTEMTRDVLVIDARHNRGGHVSELVLEKLARRVIGWDMGRGWRPVTYPSEAPRGPVVALADEFAGSDGDIITAAIRILGLGPVVGARTWGGVIGIDEGFHLVDGTSVTVPKYAFWFDRYGWGVENHGVDPDVEVLISPGDWGAGSDPQLATAVRLGMEALAERPAARPPDTSGRPPRRRPPLPPRT